MPMAPRPFLDRQQIRDDLVAVINGAANLELPGWPALTDHVDAGIEHFQAALAFLEEADGRAEHAAYTADLWYCEGEAPRV